MRALVAGWFSFPEMGATAGDLLARDVACSWLAEAGRPFDVAHADPFEGGVQWDVVDPTQYSHLIFVCGPFGNGPPVQELLERFTHCELIGLDLTMLDPLEEWNPFTLLLERDSNRTCRPDLALAAPMDPPPVLGLVLIHPQPEYRERDLHERANATIEAVAAATSCARLRVDTRLDVNEGGLRSPGEVLALLSRCDAVLTTRLHGLVLSIGCGVPAIAVDPVDGGAKITRQAQALGWPWCFPSDVSERDLAEALDECLRPDARRRARLARARGQRTLSEVREEFISVLAASHTSPRRRST